MALGLRGYVIGARATILALHSETQSTLFFICHSLPDLRDKFHENQRKIVTKIVIHFFPEINVALSKLIGRKKENYILNNILNILNNSGQ